MFPRFAFLLTCVAVFSTASPIPSSNSSCEPSTNLNPSNWQCYNIDNFLASWWSQHASECDNQPFFYCFAAFYNRTHFLCDGIGVKCNPGQLNDWTHGTESYYVLVAIANVNQYFTNLYNAITTASIITNELLPNLIKQLNPPKKGTNIWYQEFASTYLNLIFFVSKIPKIAMRLHTTAFGLLNNYLNQPADHTFTNFAQFSNELGVLTSDFQNHLTDLLNITLYDYSRFSDFASNGTFSYGNYASVNTTEQDFKQMFQSYLTDRMINLILRSKGIFAVVTSQSEGSGQRAPPGQWDVKSHLFWTDPNFRLSSDGNYPVWYLTSKDHFPEDNKNTDRVLFLNHEHLTSPEKVFGLSWKCQNQTGKLGGGFKDFDSDHPWDVNDCLYNLPVCITNNQDWDYPNRRPFLNCPYDYDPVNT